MVHRVAVVFDLRTSAMRYKIEVFVNTVEYGDICEVRKYDVN